MTPAVQCIKASLHDSPTDLKSIAEDVFLFIHLQDCIYIKRIFCRELSKIKAAAMDCKQWMAVLLEWINDMHFLPRLFGNINAPDVPITVL